MSRFRTPFDAIEDPPGLDPPLYPQAQIDPVDWDILNQADAGEGVLSGALVVASSPSALSVDVGSGQVVIDSEIWDVDATNDLAIATPNLTQPRFDLVCADNSGTPFIVDGLPASVSPLFPAGASVMGISVVLSSIYVPAGLAAIIGDHLTDKRANVPAPLQVQSDWSRVTAVSDLARSNTATLAADTVLKFPMVASGKYAVRGHAVITTLTGSNGRYGFLGPASPTFINTASWYQRNGTVTASPITSGSYDSGGTTISATSGFSYSIWFDCIIHNGSNTSPDFAFCWAQQTAVVENTIRRAGSYLEYLQVA